MTFITGVVVTFEPQQNHIENICNMSKKFDSLIIVDNSKDKIDLLDSLEYTNITILYNNNDGGIAGALNRGIAYLKKERSDYLIFLFDQDSQIPNDFIAHQVDFLLTNNENVVVPKYFDVNSRTYGNYTKLNKFTIESIFGYKLKLPTYTTFAITSGTLLKSSVFGEVGVFKESYFIDHVDSEFCIRLKYFGYKVLINPNMIFNHSIGERKKEKFLGITFKPNFHSPLRRYYVVRNSLFMLKDWGKKYPALFWLLLLRNVYEFIGVLLFEDNKINKFKAALLGSYDGLTGQVGECKRKF